MSFQVGETVGDYEIIGALGAGGMGEVYKVRNILSNRLEAMKVLLPGLVAAPDQAERFLREIRVQASLDHPNIASLRTALRIENQLVMVMELVEGPTLHALIERGPLSLKDAVHYMSQALAGLAYAHGRGVIHRDIKPGNIMLSRDGVIKLTDFGIAKVAQDQKLAQKLTKTGATMGSLYYMSPEQVKGGALDARSDLYSLGVTLYESATGSRPFQGDTDYAILSAHLQNPPEPPAAKNPNISPELDRIILKSLAKEPADRFQSADEFREALQGVRGLAEATPVAQRTVLASSVPLSPPATPAQPAPRPAGAQPTPSGNLEMAYVLFMDLVSYSMLPMDQQSERIQQLAQIVRNTEEFRRAEKTDQIISLPTGDGMALVFFQNPVAAIQCAIEISKALKNEPDLKLRMGIHSGPVYRIPDINKNLNVAGGGINLAQRVMDCGDAGHILVSKSVADILGQLSTWAGYLHDLGEQEVKHGVKVQVVNFYTGEAGNAELPQKLRQKAAAHAATAAPAPAPVPVGSAAPRRNAYVLAGAGLVAAIAIVFGVSRLLQRQDAGGGKTPATPASMAPSLPSTPQPPRPPAGAPAGTPPAGMTPPSAAAVPPSSPPQAAGVSNTKQAPQSRPGTAAQAAAAVPQRSAEPQPAQQAPPVAASAPQAPPAAASNPALQELRERMILLAARAGAVRNSMETLERQQRQSGLSMRSDMAAAKSSAEYLMEEAKGSLASGDVAATTRNLDLAERQIEKLEGFLGR